ncbi:sensor histidine kinase [Galbibacter mesophilus]|uniref:sensor histidine kinase n=1 Tax=Galbibacter mesophilus TaxID=379069 RepID=UPI001F5DC514|nr:histidine kinase dimerization/phosphoacceptor domain -containing protein [Galbibacter mesophilus]MCM5661644.1 sensor histidine kinase [Galbibacter mesophilus]
MQFVFMGLNKGASDSLQEKIDLILNTNYFSSIIMLCFAPICYFILDITEVIPQTFLVYGIANLVNTFMYYKHGKVMYIYLGTCFLALIGSAVVTLYSGGLNSPFAFVMLLIVFGGYVSTRAYGRFNLIIILTFILAVYFHESLHFSVKNKVPPASQETFSLIVLLFSMYILGAILGRILLRNYNRLLTSKKEIEKKSKENEVLLKEIHHRVKNNLQTISSLLNMQARNSTSEETKRMLSSSHNRVLSMAIVHEMLYAREDLARIEYQDYIAQLCSFLDNSLNKNDKKIVFQTNIKNIKFNVETAIPLGLLISEFITNSFKHAFPHKDEGTITISIEQTDLEYFRLTLSDDGVGYAEDNCTSSQGSMGLKLINSLTRQLRGSINKLEATNGVTYLIRFKEI